MHSKWKMQKYYPEINDSILKAFYGSSEESLYWDEKHWERFDRIDLNDFFVKTQPDIEIQNCLFDGVPYTKCISVPPSDTYSKSACEMVQLIREIVDKCNCQPDYLHNLPERDFVQKFACSFFDNAKCVAQRIKRYVKKPRALNRTCLPACQSYEFKPVTIQYEEPSNTRKDTDQYFMRAVLRTTEEKVTFVEEHSTYSTNKFVTDVLVYLGLILALTAVCMQCWGRKSDGRKSGGNFSLYDESPIRKCEKIKRIFLIVWK
ncbi:Oidioi.mRNA.OKI2018_I69.chr1.g1517.t1.cds [Oikopleura dioica]|uniref:Oidioi.mRNA.OKI2018_I69.chr1.g1517.t1.cds n=1 Tax=Oikopleura dioica TaxID=34765 RepID=A0ABN7SN65_OIKDI|nr:Oidioi.mRNA.OKI2018_I69.chr1.g1517.t1.cds [Oikopleura dioica]